MHESPLSLEETRIVEELDSIRAREEWSLLAQTAARTLEQMHGGESPTCTIAVRLRLSEGLAHCGQTNEALAELEVARTQIRTSSVETQLAELELIASFAHYRRGDLDQAEAHAFACLASSDLQLGVPAFEAAARDNIGLVAMHRGEWKTARRHLERSIEITRGMTSIGKLYRRQNNLAVCLYWAGEWATAEHIIANALKDCSGTECGLSLCSLNLLLGGIHIARWNRNGALDRLAAARSSATSLGAVRELALADELEGDLALDAGDLATAESCYTRTIDTGARTAPAGDLVYEGERKLARVRRRQGRPDEARALAAHAYELSRNAGTVVEIGASLRELALAEAALGNATDARAHAHEAVDVLRGVGERYELAHTLIECTDLIDEDARTLLTEARGHAQHLGIDAMFTNIERRLAALPSHASRPSAQSSPVHIERLAVGDDKVFITTDDRLLVDLRRGSRNKSRVLIEGETGTGKELIARYLHVQSGRRGPFVWVECTSLNESLAHSELFGHTRGAFTGAHTDARGLVDVANGGTLFLDEVGDLPLALQGRLLRLLQEKEYRPVGAAQAKRVDVYVVAATNRVLADMVETGTFREDLYYRLRGATVRVPPLRERASDVLPLAAHFLHIHGARLGRTVTIGEDAANILRCYAWPGNVRQLEHEVENIVAQLDDGDVAQSWVLSAEVVAGAASGAGSALTFRERMDAMLVAEVQRALLATGGNRSRTAELLGFSRRGLQKMLKRVGLVPGAEVGSERDEELESGDD